jgi:hypothetical protein
MGPRLHPGAYAGPPICGGASASAHHPRGGSGGMRVERRPGGLEYNRERRKQLRDRYEEVKAQAQVIDSAVQKLRQHTRSHHYSQIESLRLRRRFVYRDDPAPGDASDRRLPAPKERPPVGRIVSPNGVALRLLLLAIFEAQTHTQPGKSPGNLLPLRAGGNEVGWADLIAVPARGQGRGMTRSATVDLKIRRLHSALRTLAKRENQLVHLPSGGRRYHTYERFLLNDEGGSREHGNTPRYVVPATGEAGLFGLPSGLITNGWIHVLTDAELRMLMMIADQQAATGRQMVEFSGDLRLLHYAVGYDSYEANLVLERFGLIHVEEQERHSDSRIVDYDRRFAAPHRFQLQPDGFEEQPVYVVTQELGKI